MDLPEHNKLKAVKSQSQAIGQFLDDHRQRNIELCEMDSNGDYHPLYKTIQQILAEYFEIDLNQLEEEKLALIDLLRSTKPCPCCAGTAGTQPDGNLLGCACCDGTGRVKVDQ